MNLAQTFYSHPKSMIAALNGPAIGMSAALLGFCDFIYATPKTYVLTPFASLGLVTEGCASMEFVQRMGVAKTNEALLMGRKITSEHLKQCGFINKIFEPSDSSDGASCLKQVLSEVHERLGDHLDQDSLLKIKDLVRPPSYRATLDSQNVKEAMEGVQPFVEGAPQGQFEKFATGQKRHRL